MRCLLTINSPLTWVRDYCFWLWARKSIVAWLTPVPRFGSGVWKIFDFVVYLSCSRLISASLIPIPGLHKYRRGEGELLNSTITCTDRIRCRAYHQSNMLLLQVTLMSCGYCFFPYWFWTAQRLWTVVFCLLKSGWKFLAKSQCFFGGCGNNRLWFRP